MIRFVRYALALVFVYALQGCSRMEQFAIFNNSDKPVYVIYELDPGNKGTFPIFTDRPSSHKLNSSGDIDWEEEADAINDSDNNLNTVSVSLQPHSALIFGTLLNDEYAHHDQQFINGRWFNLKKIQIRYNNAVLDIIPATFDQHFKKHRGKVCFVVE
jgi:hypothetical protein